MKLQRERARVLVYNIIIKSPRRASVKASPGEEEEKEREEVKKEEEERLVDSGNDGL